MQRTVLRSPENKQDSRNSGGSVAVTARARDIRLPAALFAVLILAISFVFSDASAQAPPEISVQVAPELVSERHFGITVQADGFGQVPVKSIQTVINYDPTAIAVDSISLAPDFAEGCESENSTDPAEGVLNLFVTCGTARVGASLGVWQLSAYAGPTAEAVESGIGIGNTVAFDGENQAVVVAVVNAAPVIQPGACGDQNLDGTVNVLDMVGTLRHIVGLTEFSDVQSLVTDIDGNGAVGVSDAVAGLRFVSGLDRVITECGVPYEMDNGSIELSGMDYAPINPLATTKISEYGGGIPLFSDPPCDCPDTAAAASCDACIGQDTGDDVILSNGELALRYVDLEIPGRGFNWKFERSYRSGAVHEGLLGHNWDFNYNRRLVTVSGANLTDIQKTFPTAGSGDVVRMDGFARADVYIDKTGGSYAAPVGYYTGLEKLGNNTFTEVDTAGTKVVFSAPDASGLSLMSSLSDRHGNTMQFEYDSRGRLTRVLDTLGRPIDYFYGKNGRLGAVVDFSGRVIRFSYDVNRNLIGVTSPAVTGTPNGNDFPEGKTESYAYTAGSRYEQFNHNLVSITAPNETAVGGPPRFQFDYDLVLGSASEDRVLTQTAGGTNATGVPSGNSIQYDYELLNPPNPNQLTDVHSRTTVIDRNGNSTRYEFNATGHALTIRENTNRNVRASDPAYFETVMSYNADGEMTELQYPLGNSLSFSFNTSNTDRLQHGNLIGFTRTPDSARLGDQSRLVETYTYEPLFGQVRTLTDPRGNAAGYVPDNGGLNSPARYTTTYTYDYEESCDLSALAASLGSTPQKAQQLLLGAGICTAPLGDVNGDGVTDQAFGNVIRIESPSVLLITGSPQALAEGNTSQEIVELYRYNDFSQVIGHTDPEGNTTTYDYYPERDPDGDGLVNNPNGGQTQGGYTKTEVADTSSSPARNSRTNPAPVKIQTDYEYDMVGNIIREIDGRGIATDYDVNQLNQVVTITRAAASGLRPTGPAEPQPLTDFKFIDRFFYDHNDNFVIEQVEDRGNTSGVDGNPPSSAIAFGVPMSPDPVGGPAFIDTVRRYDILDNEIETVEEVKNGVGLEFLNTNYRYDANENLVLIIQPEGNAESQVYDERDLEFQVTRGALAAPVAALTGPQDQSTFVVRGGLASTTTLHYDDNRNLIESVDATDTDFSTANNSDLGGQGDRTRYLYDGFDRETSVIVAVGYQDVAQYDPAGNIVRTLTFGPTGGSSPSSDGGDIVRTPVSLLGAIQGARLVNTNLLEATEYRYDELSRPYREDAVLFFNSTTPVRPLDLKDGATDLGKGNLTPGDSIGILGISGITVLGRVTTRTDFDRNSRPTFKVEDDADIHEMRYDGTDRVTFSVDAEDNQFETAWDDNDNVIEVRETDFSQLSGVSNEVFLSTVFYDALNRPTSKVDNAGYASYYRHDSRDNLVAFADANGPSSGRTITRRVFPSGPNTVNTVNEFGNVTAYTYDGLNRNVLREIRVTASGLGDGINIGANLDGTPAAPPAVSAAAAGGDGLIRTARIWDENSLQTALVDDNGNVTLYLYDDLDRQIVKAHGLTVGSTPLTNTLVLAGNVITNRGARLGEPSTISGSLVDAQLASAQTRLAAIGPLFPALAARVDDNPPTTEILGYDRDDNISLITDENGTTIDYDFDAINRQVFSTITPATAVIGTVQESWEYDGLSRLTRAEDLNDDGDGTDDATVTYAYDSLSRVVEESLQIGILPAQVTSSGWRAEDLKSSLIYPNGREITFTYDSIDRIKSIDESPSGQLVAYDYIGDNRVLERRYSANGTRLSFVDPTNSARSGYDELRRPVNLRHTRSDGSLIAGFDYSYDREHNRLSETKTHDPANSELSEYDSAYRLTNFDRPATGAVAPLDSSWDLDGAGNWDRVDTETREHSSVNEIISFSDGATTAVLSDNNGNVINDGTFAYAYDYQNRLRTVTRASNSVLIATYSYDGAGRRIRKVVHTGTGAGTTDYYYDNWNVIEERDAANALAQQYVYGMYIDEPLVIDRNLDGDSLATGGGDSRLYYHQNASYSVYALTDELGQTAEGYLYDAYGRQTVLTPGSGTTVKFDGSDVITSAGSSALGNPYLFTGRRLDAESGLYYYRMRMLDADLGRFIQRDPIGGWTDALNLGNSYTFVGNNTGKYLDPTGLWSPPSGWEIAQGATDFLRGMGDTITFGGTKWVREKIHGKKGKVINKTAYKGGEVAGTVLECAGGGAGVVKVVCKVAAKKAAKAAAKKAAKKGLRKFVKPKKVPLLKKLKKAVKEGADRARAKKFNKKYGEGGICTPGTKAKKGFRSKVTELESGTGTAPWPGPVSP